MVGEPWRPVALVAAPEPQSLRRGRRPAARWAGATHLCNFFPPSSSGWRHHTATEGEGDTPAPSGFRS
jgi:hypothetical protein